MLEAAAGMVAGGNAGGATEAEVAVAEGSGSGFGRMCFNRLFL